MSKFERKLLILAALLLVFLIPAGVVFAQGPSDVPPPYAGMKNPNPWGDSSAQQAGKTLYQSNCLGCHGVNGNNIAASDFSADDFPTRLETSADFYYWILTEGDLSKGMPGFKSGLSDIERWQILTYLWTLNSVTSSPTPTTPVPSGGEIIKISAPAHATAGDSLTLKATLLDKDRQPISGATVKFLVDTDFFTTGLMDIGEATTDGKGGAVLNYVPRISGDVQLVADYGGTRSSSPISLADSGTPFYEVEVGIKIPNVGQDVFLGPQNALELGPMGTAPVGGFRLPGGYLSWLLVLVLIMAAIWITYFRIFLQLFHFALPKTGQGPNERLVPILGMIFATVMGVVLIGILFHGPYSHFHVLR